MACFADIDVSQGSVATYARCDGIFNIHLTANLPKKISSEKNILIGYDLTVLWSRVCGRTFLAHPMGIYCDISASLSHFALLAHVL